MAQNPAGRATVKAVNSGDTVVLMGAAQPNAPPPELMVTLAALEAPRMARFLFDAGIVRPGIGRVDGNHARRDAFHMEPGAHVFQLFAVLPAFGAEIGRHVFRGNQC